MSSYVVIEFGRGDRSDSSNDLGVRIAERGSAMLRDLIVDQRTKGATGQKLASGSAMIFAALVAVFAPLVGGALAAAVAIVSTVPLVVALFASQRAQSSRGLDVQGGAAWRALHPSAAVADDGERLLAFLKDVRTDEYLEAMVADQQVVYGILTEKRDANHRVPLLIGIAFGLYAVCLGAAFAVHTLI